MPNRSVIQRLSHYKNIALRLQALNFKRVFSSNLANAAGGTAPQVRKDFSRFGITGNRRGGYPIDSLLEQLNRILGKDKIQKLVLIGVGKIGQALLNYQGFINSQIQIAAGFDIDPTHFNPTSDPPVLPLEDLDGFVKSQDIELGIIAVPDFAAQQVYEMLASSGILGVLNFAPIRLHNTRDIVITSINLESEIENLVYFVNERKTDRKVTDASL